MLATLIELAAPSVSRAVTLHHPPAGQHIHTSVCPAADGINVLVPDPVQNADETFLLLSPSQAIQDELAGGDTSYDDWTFDYTGGTLSGDFYVDVYKSSFVGDHNSGCEINMRYKKGPGIPPTCAGFSSSPPTILSIRTVRRRPTRPPRRTSTPIPTTPTGRGTCY